MSDHISVDPQAIHSTSRSFEAASEDALAVINNAISRLHRHHGAGL